MGSQRVPHQIRYSVMNQLVSHVYSPVRKRISVPAWEMVEGRVTTWVWPRIGSQARDLAWAQAMEDNDGKRK
jgi:hypothetical protein